MEKGPDPSLEPTADAVQLRTPMDSSLALRVSLPRLTRLWLICIRQAAFFALEQRTNNANESYERENRRKQPPFGSVHRGGCSALRRWRRDKDQHWCLRRHDRKGVG